MDAREYVCCVRYCIKPFCGYRFSRISNIYRICFTIREIVYNFMQTITLPLCSNPVRWVKTFFSYWAFLFSLSFVQTSGGLIRSMRGVIFVRPTALLSSFTNSLFRIVRICVRVDYFSAIEPERTGIGSDSGVFVHRKACLIRKTKNSISMCGPNRWG